MDELINLVSTLNDSQVERLLSILQDDGKQVTRLRLLDCMKEITTCACEHMKYPEQHKRLTDALSFLCDYDDLLLTLTPSTEG